jgi:hypothetical protein
MSNLERLNDLARGFNDAELAQVIDFVEQLKRKAKGAPADFERVKAMLDALPEEDITPEEAAELDRRKAEPRVTLEELGL